MPLPEKIANAPMLNMGLEFYFTAFLDLMDCRSMGMGEGPIPWTAINDYCIAYELYGEMRQDTMYHVKRLDKVYLEHKNKARKSTPIAPPKPPKRGR